MTHKNADIKLRRKRRSTLKSKDTDDSKPTLGKARRANKEDLKKAVRPINDIKVIVSLGTSAYSHDIVQKKISLESLFNNFKKPEYQSKKDGKYFVFASFKENVRNAKNLDKYYGATVDIDDTELSLQEVRSKFSKWTNCIYTTYSHTLKGKGNRYRVVIPYSMPIEVNYHVDTMFYLMDILESDSADKAAKSVSTPAYFPAVNAKNKNKFKCVINRSNLLNPFDQKIQDAIPGIKFKYYKDAEEKEELDLNKDIAEGERNSTLARVTGKFIKNGVTKDELYGMVDSYNQSKINPPLCEKDLKVIVNSVLKSHTRNHEDLEWGFDEMIRRIQKSVDIKGEFTHLCKMIAYARLHNRLTIPEFEMVVNDLRTKSGVSKTVINTEITKSSLELQGEDSDALEEIIEAESDTLRERFKDWVYIATEDRIYNTYNGVSYKREAFNAMFHNQKLKTSIFSVLIQYNLINKVARVEFDPEADKIYIRDRVQYVNAYIDPQLKAKRGDVTTLLKHFDYLIPSDYERNIILDFIAHLVQKPGKKIRWMLIIKGPKGVGKTIIAEKLILNLIGFSNFGKVSNSLIGSDFNAWQTNAQLLVFEELDTGTSFREKQKLTNKLKEFITDNILKLHKKGLDPYDVLNKTCCVGFTNVDDPVIITADERRFCMVRTDAKPKNAKYYEKLAEFCDTDLPAIYYYFMNRDISKFRYAKAPDTLYTKELKLMSMPWPGAILQEVIDKEMPEYFNYGITTTSILVDVVRLKSTGKYKNFADDLLSPGSVYGKQMTIMMREMGFTIYTKPKRKDHRFWVNGKRQTVWIIPGSNAEDVNSIRLDDIPKILGSVKVSADYSTAFESEFEDHVEKEKR